MQLYEVCTHLRDIIGMYLTRKVFLDKWVNLTKPNPKQTRTDVTHLKDLNPNRLEQNNFLSELYFFRPIAGSRYTWICFMFAYYN